MRPRHSAPAFVGPLPDRYEFPQILASKAAGKRRGGGGVSSAAPADSGPGGGRRDAGHRRSERRGGRGSPAPRAVPPARATGEARWTPEWSPAASRTAPYGALSVA